MRKVDISGADRGLSLRSQIATLKQQPRPHSAGTEIGWEARQIALDLFIEALSGHSIKISELAVEQHALASKDKYELDDVLNRHHRA
jgi:hypothetical protein